MKNSKSAFNAPDECSGDFFSFGRSRGTVGLYVSSPRLKAVGFTLQSLTHGRKVLLPVFFFIQPHAFL